MTFGQKLKYYREARNITQSDFSKRVGVDQSAVSKWESDQSVPRFSTIQQIARILGVNTDQLTTDGDEEGKKEMAEEDVLLPKHISPQFLKRLVAYSPPDFLFFDEYSKLSDDKKRELIRQLLIIRDRPTRRKPNK